MRISSFSKVAMYHFTFSPASSLWSFSFSTSSTMLVIICIDSSYPYWYEMVSHWGFDFHFLGEVIYMLYISVPYKIFKNTSHSVSSFHFLDGAFWGTFLLFDFGEVQFIYFLLFLLLMVSSPRNHCLFQHHEDLILCFLLRV